MRPCFLAVARHAEIVAHLLQFILRQADSIHQGEPRPALQLHQSLRASFVGIGHRRFIDRCNDLLIFLGLEGTNVDVIMSDLDRR
jgi:hypothetical protein